MLHALFLFFFGCKRCLSVFFFFLVVFCLFVFVFFFQAEDGIRDRSPSRGLGDVYKRQVFIIILAINVLAKVNTGENTFKKNLKKVYFFEALHDNLIQYNSMFLFKPLKNFFTLLFSDYYN